MSTDAAADAGHREHVPHEYQRFYLAKVLVLQMAYTDFYDYLLVDPDGWFKYEQLIRLERGRDTDGYLDHEPDLGTHWQNRHLRLFMRQTHGEGFPPAPSGSTLERIIRLTGTVERKQPSEGRKQEDNQFQARYKLAPGTEQST